MVWYDHAMKKTRDPLERTSVQLPRQAVEYLDSWPRLTRSEVLRLTVDRYGYLEGVAAVAAEHLVEKYRPVFHVALAELSFTDYKVVARSLPAIVMGAMAEENVREDVEREHRNGGMGDMIEWAKLKAETEALSAVERIRVLDYVTGQRYLQDE